MSPPYTMVWSGLHLSEEPSTGRVCTTPRLSLFGWPTVGQLCLPGSELELWVRGGKGCIRGCC